MPRMLVLWRDKEHERVTMKTEKHKIVLLIFHLVGLCSHCKF